MHCPTSKNVAFRRVSLQIFSMLCQRVTHPSLLFTPKTIPGTFHSLCNCSVTMSNEAEPAKPTSQNTLQILHNYPVPLSPPLPSISKQIELGRAMSASSKSSLFALSRSDVVYEDDWLVAVNKPQGVYCESVLASVPNVICDLAQPGILSEAHIVLFFIFYFLIIILLILVFLALYSCSGEWVIHKVVNFERLELTLLHLNVLHSHV